MLNIRLLNPLRQAGPEATLRLHTDISNYLLGALADPTRAAAFITGLVAETRYTMVEQCRARLIEVFDQEAWRCAIRWWSARQGGGIPPMVCNMMLASALTSLTVVDALRTDGEETVHAVDVDGQGFAFPVLLEAPTGLARN